MKSKINGFIRKEFLEKDEIILNKNQLSELLERFLIVYTKKPKIVVDVEKVKEYNSIFPNRTLPNGKYGVSTERIVIKCFEWFFRTYPEFNWEIILKATKLYVETYEKQDYNFMRTSQYFIVKQVQNKIETSDLADWCMKVSQGDDEDDFTKDRFHEKVL